MKEHKSQFRFFPQKSQGKPFVYPVVAFDVETNTDTGNMVLACVYGERFKATHIKAYERGLTRNEIYRKDIVKVSDIDGNPLIFYNDVDLQDYLSKLYHYTNKPHPSCIIAGFNLSHDLKYIFNVVDEPLFAGTRFISAEIPITKKTGVKGKSTGIEVHDLTNHVDGSLEKWIGLLNMKEKGIEKTEWRPDLELSELIYHCQQDTKATYELGKFITNFYYEKFNLKLYHTVASAALHIFAKDYFHETWQRKYDDFNIYEDKAFYGGRCEPIRKGIFKLTTYDINSTYLDVQHKKLIPNPNTAVWGGETSFDVIRDKYDYIITCDVFIPKQHIAPLPFHDEKLHNLVFPCGYITGSWCKPEFEYALNHCGVEILKIHNFCYYTESKPYFREFASDIWELRLEYKAAKNDGMSLMVKKIGNALYGKFDEKHKKDSIVLENQYEPDINPFCEFEINGVRYVKSFGAEEYSYHAFPVVNAFITSYARLKLFMKMKEYEDDVIYVDTDSVKLPQGIPFVSSNELGGFKNEGDLTQKIIRSKFYLTQNKAGNWDINESKIGGVPKRATFIENITTAKQGEGAYHYTYKAPFRMGESIKKYHKNGMRWNMWETKNKYLSVEDRKRHWISKTKSDPLYYNKLK